MDDLLFNLMLQLDLKEIKNMCLVNKTANQICDNPYFWQEKMKIENIQSNVYSMDRYELLLSVKDHLSRPYYCIATMISTESLPQELKKSIPSNEKWFYNLTMQRCGNMYVLSGNIYFYHYKYKIVMAYKDLFNYVAERRIECQLLNDYVSLHKDVVKPVLIKDDKPWWASGARHRDI